MINDLNINISNGNLNATYTKNDIKYQLNINSFILPKGKDLYSYITNKIMQDEYESHNFWNNGKTYIYS